MKVTRVHLLRHGQVEGHGQKRYNGQGDVRLTDYGKKQSISLSERFQQIDLAAIYASDLQRCRFAADRIALQQQVKPIYLPGLRELHVGAWEGRTWQELERDDPELWQARLNDIVNVAPPQGESLLQLATRIRPVVKELVAAHIGAEIVIVAHGGVNRVVLLDAIGAPLTSLFHIEQDYGCHNIIDYYDDGIAVVKRLNA